MKNLVSEIVTYLKSQTFSPVPEIRDAYSKKVPTYPMIVVQEIDNSNRVSLLGQEILSNLGYQIDIFSKDMVSGGIPVSGVEIVNNLGETVDAKLQEQYGMTRTSAVGLPDVNDATVSRLSLRYTGILDVTTDYMYR